MAGERGSGENAAQGLGAVSVRLAQAEPGIRRGGTAAPSEAPTTASGRILPVSRRRAVPDRQAAAGGPASALAYLVVRLKLARITSYEVESDIGDEGEQTLTERLTLTFKNIEIEHKAQSGDGGGGGGSLFMGEVNPQG